MKTKTLLLTALLAGAGFASAQTTNTNTVVYIAGSQAFSRLDNLALHDYASKNGYTLVASTGSTNPVPAKALLYRKETRSTNGGRVTVSLDLINVHQTGSEAGIQSLAGTANQTIPFLPNDARTLGLPDVDASYSNNQQAAIATSPVWQRTSRFAAGARVNGVKYRALPEVVATGSTALGIAAQTWGWSASSNFPTNAANISAQVARALLRDGHVPLSFFTGNPADATNGVWLVGRDIAAGARIAALSEPGHGALNPVNQYRVSSSNGQVTLIREPATTVMGIPQPLGNSGYNGTSSQLAAVKTTLPANLQVDHGNGLRSSPYSGNNYLIQYNGFAQSIDPGVVTLRYNGVAPSTDAVASGAYSFWTYEHLYIVPRLSRSNANAPVIANYVASYIQGLTSAQISGNSGPGYLNVNDLQVVRSSDGGVITRK